MAKMDSEEYLQAEEAHFQELTEKVNRAVGIIIGFNQSASIYLFGSMARRRLPKQPENNRKFHPTRSDADLMVIKPGVSKSGFDEIALVQQLNDELGQLGQPGGIDVNILDLTNCLDAQFLQKVFNSGEAISLYEPEKP
jgi:predicted nucleotidyltransferase